MTDIVFAVDSIPAIFAITTDPFIVFTSDTFAILGLRALYFLLAGMIGKFQCLKVNLRLVLAFVGAKMLLVDVVKMPIALLLGIVGSLLGLSVAASLLFPAKGGAAKPLAAGEPADSKVEAEVPWACPRAAQTP